MKKQTVVRSYSPNCGLSAKELETALKDGYQLVRASEFIPSQGDKAGYIEYILEKNEDSKEEEKLKAELEKAKAEVEFLKAKSEDLEAQKNTLYDELNLNHLGIVKALVVIKEIEKKTKHKDEWPYILAKKIEKILKAAGNITEAEISEAEEEGGTEC